MNKEKKFSELNEDELKAITGGMDLTADKYDILLGCYDKVKKEMGLKEVYGNNEGMSRVSNCFEFMTNPENS